MRHALFVFAIFTFFVLLASCEKKEEAVVSDIKYIDGQYSATSSIKDDWGGSAKIELTVKDGKIASCVFYSYEKDGKLKDAEYGKVNGEIKNMGIYKIAQTAVLESSKYGDALVKTQDIDKVDALSGATVSFALFKDAAKQALRKAMGEENVESSLQEDVSSSENIDNKPNDECDGNEEECDNCGG